MKIEFKKACLSDCGTLIDVNNRAYRADFVRFGECPGYNVSAENMRASVMRDDTEKFLVCVDGKPVGAVSIHKLSENSFYLGNLCVVPEYQHRGIGKMAIDYILSRYDKLTELNLVTPAEKRENIDFYTRKCGFKVTGTEMDGGVKVAKIRYTR